MSRLKTRGKRSARRFLPLSKRSVARAPMRTLQWRLAVAKQPRPVLSKRRRSFQQRINGFPALKIACALLLNLFKMAIPVQLTMISCSSISAPKTTFRWQPLSMALSIARHCLWIIYVEIQHRYSSKDTNLSLQQLIEWVLWNQGICCHDIPMLISWLKQKRASHSLLYV